MGWVWALVGLTAFLAVMWIVTRRMSGPDSHAVTDHRRDQSQGSPPSLPGGGS